MKNNYLICFALLGFLLVSCQKDYIDPQPLLDEDQKNIAVLRMLINKQGSEPDFIRYVTNCYSSKEDCQEAQELGGRIIHEQFRSGYRLKPSSIFDQAQQQFASAGVNLDNFDERYAGGIQYVAYEIGHRAPDRNLEEDATDIIATCLDWLYTQKASDPAPYAEMLLKVKPMLSAEDFERHRNYITARAREIILDKEKAFVEYGAGADLANMTEAETLEAVMNWLHDNSLYNSSLESLRLLSAEQ